MLESLEDKMRMYAVVHKDHVKISTVLLMGKTIAQAVDLWEEYNHGQKFRAAKADGWIVVKYNVGIMA
jgi:hypothetical protein